MSTKISEKEKTAKKEGITSSKLKNSQKVEHRFQDEAQKRGIKRPVIDDSKLLVYPSESKDSPKVGGEFGGIHGNESSLDENKDPTKLDEFLLSAKNLHLTYLDCDLYFPRLVEILKQKLASYHVRDWLVVQVDNDRGSHNLEVYIKTVKKVVLISSTFLHIRQNFKEYHGIYKGAKNPNLILDSMLKGRSTKTTFNLYCSKRMSILIESSGNLKVLYGKRAELSNTEPIVERKNMGQGTMLVWVG